MQEEAYVFELKMICGGYVYFSTYTYFIKFVQYHREIRKPCSVSKSRFIEAATFLGHSPFVIEDDEGFNLWLRAKGWAAVEIEYAHRSMPQWLKSKECVSSATGVFTDIEIVSPSTLKRSYSGRRKESVVIRDGSKCIECGSQEQLTMQHIIPFSKGGETTSRNLVTLCEPCNQKMGNIEDVGLFKAAQLHHNYDRSLINHHWYSPEHSEIAMYISKNLMQTRCDIW